VSPNDSFARLNDTFAVLNDTFAAVSDTFPGLQIVGLVAGVAGVAGCMPRIYWLTVSHIHAAVP